MCDPEATATKAISYYSVWLPGVRLAQQASVRLHSVVGFSHIHYPHVSNNNKTNTSKLQNARDASLTGERHPQLPPQRLGDPHGNQSLDLLRAKHVDAAAELGEVILPQTLLRLLHALTHTHERIRNAKADRAGLSPLTLSPSAPGRFWWNAVIRASLLMVLRRTCSSSSSSSEHPAS